MSETQEMRDAAYENGGFIPDAAAYPPRWEEDAQAFRVAQDGALDLAYGDDPRARFDLFYPDGKAQGLFVFVHGGYWKARSKSDWSHFVAGALDHGFAAAVVGYPLAPQVCISEITQHISAGVTAAAAKVEGPIRLAGHSAGGHLVARMAMPGVLPADVAARVDRVLPISPVADLRPLLELSMNDVLRLDTAEAAAESPVLGGKLGQIDVATAVGAQERPAFLDQNRWLAEAWDIPQIILPGRHHFDVLDALVTDGSPLLRFLFR